MKECKCKECNGKFNKRSNKIGAIYKEDERGVNVDYFICRDCLDISKHFHQLNMRWGWSHLYGDISSDDLGWMKMVVGKTLDTVCGEAGYTYLNT
ncbi:MAG: hypothetical protein Unbinned3818contig1000_3 [Prokaryotic dsDNA virus sp.]|nr:hypothetical protein [Phycisphaerae bacterium]QDP45932.1 MAG: hypothetical protein Unbinned3818contig1000_3 [Prokaryotic dsDNA virus sp.]|tara:strand:+ start:227 stop:511 length:285 start_codon:yes stop_codon:yes gene_type:complete